MVNVIKYTGYLKNAPRIETTNLYTPLCVPRSRRASLDMVGFYLFLVLVQLHSAQSVTKIWKSSALHNEWQPIGYDAECAANMLVYQPQGAVQSAVPITKSHLSRIVLPEYGAIVIPDTNPIVLQDPETVHACPSGWRNYMQQKPSSSKSWYSPDMWSIENDTLNVATPHVDRIPCECDTAAISTDSLFVRMTDIDDVVVAAVNVNGQSGTLRQLVGSELGTMMLGQTAAETQDAQCLPHPRFCGCHSPERFERIAATVCANVQCPAAACDESVRPLGHCCSICGAVLQAKSFGNECDDFSVANVANKLQKVLRGNDEIELLSRVWMYSNSYPNLDSGPMERYVVQLVMVDRGDSYGDHSARLAKIIGEHLREIIHIIYLFK